MTIHDGVHPIPWTRRYSVMGAQMLAEQRRTAAMYAERLYTIRETSALLSVHPSTIHRWILEGAIQAARATKRGHWKIPHREIIRLRSEGEKKA